MSAAGLNRLKSSQTLELVLWRHQISTSLGSTIAPLKDSSRPADDFYKSRTRQIVSQIDRVQKNNLKINWAKIVPLQRIYTSNLFLIASTSRKNWAYLEM